VDKTRKIHNNLHLAKQTLTDMFAEFQIAKDLKHPNIIRYKYFMRKYNESSKTYEFHILMELMDGEDMETYITEQGRPYMVERIKEIGG